MTTMNVQVPDIGDFDEVGVIEILVKAGDTVQVEQSLITVESDKASMEIPSSHAGVVKELKVALGDKVKMGSVVLVLEVADAGAPSPQPSPAGGGSDAAASTPVVAAPTLVSTQTAPQNPPPAGVGSRVGVTAALASGTGQIPHASPSIRKAARELGIPLAEVQGTGEKGRITLQDLQNFSQGVMSGSMQTAAQRASGLGASSSGAASSAAAGSLGGGLDLLPWPKVDFSKFGEVEAKPLSRIKKISGQNLARNWVMIPHVTVNENADVTELEAFRVQMNKEYEKQGVKFSMLAFIIKAVVAALKKYPEFNASLDGDNLVLKKYYHIGFAADTPNGLMVPVLKDADKKGVAQIAQEMSALAAQAREGKLKPADMQGGCFTISSLGGIGGTSFTPIINAPEVAILGVMKAAMQPVWNGSAFEPRLLCPLCLSFDHRVIDGAAAARFNVYLAQALADFRRVMM